MKIMHVINSLATGGAERLVVNLAKCGRELGHDVSIIVLQDKDGIPKSVANDYGLEVIVLAKSLKDPRIPMRLRQATKHADIVHAHIFPVFYWAATLSKPKVYTEHRSFNRRMGKRLFKLPEKWAYGRYDQTIVISAGVQEALEKHLRSIGSSPNISFAANGINSEFFSIEREYAAIPSNIAIIASLQPIKQHSIAIQAVAKLKNITLNIAGDGPLRTELEELADQLGVNDRINFLGNVKDIPDLLKQNDLLLCTSAHEGLSTVVIEAQASGIPVVGPDIAGVNDVIIDGKTGLLYQEHNPKIVAERISEALDPKVYPKLCSNARDNVMNYSIENSFDAQLEIYKQVLT